MVASWLYCFTQTNKLKLSLFQYKKCEYFSNNGNKDLKTLSIPLTVKVKVLVLFFIPIVFKVLVIISIICLLDSTFNCRILNKGIITTVLFGGFHSNLKCKVPSPKKVRILK